MRYRCIRSSSICSASFYLWFILLRKLNTAALSVHFLLYRSFQATRAYPAGAMKGFLPTNCHALSVPKRDGTASATNSQLGKYIIRVKFKNEILCTPLSSSCYSDVHFNHLLQVKFYYAIQRANQVAPSVQRRRVWLVPTTSVQCSNAAKTRKPLKFAGVPQTRQQISAVSRPKFTVL